MSALGLFLAVAGILLVYWALGGKTFGITSALPGGGNSA